MTERIRSTCTLSGLPGEQEREVDLQMTRKNTGIFDMTYLLAVASMLIKEGNSEIVM